MDSRINPYIRGSVSRNESVESFRDRLKKKKFSDKDIKEAVEIYSRIPKKPEIHEKTSVNPFMIFMIIVTILVISVSAFYFLMRPSCGNGVIEFGENDMTCCEDAGCMKNQVCSKNRCRNCGTCEYFEDGVCLPYTCCISPDCDDSDPETLDICTDGGTAHSTCSYLQKQCTSDLGCMADEYCEGNRCEKNVLISPISFRKRLEMSAKGGSIWKIQQYREARNDANLSGIFLDKAMEKEAIAGTANGWFFGVIADMKSAPRCSRDYIIEKTEESTSFIGEGGERLIPDEKRFFVRAWKLDSEKKTLLFDEHIWNGRLRSDENTRRIEVVSEVGCGSLPGFGSAWSNESLFMTLPDNTYGSVKFDFSRVYNIEAQFGEDGSYSLISKAHDISISG